MVHTVAVSPNESQFHQSRHTYHSNSDQSLGIYDLISADVGHMTHNVTLLIIKYFHNFCHLPGRKVLYK